MVVDHPIAKSAKFFHAHSPGAERPRTIKRAIIGTFAVVGMLTIFVMPGKGAASGWIVQGCGDFNGDRKSDVFWQSATGQTRAWLMNGDRIDKETFYDLVQPTSGWTVQGFGDFNGDGKTDVFWYNSNTGETSAWLMNGDRVSQYTKYAVVEPSSGWTVQGFGDFNGDGKDDVFWYQTTGDASVWLMNGDHVDKNPRIDQIERHVFIN